MTDELLSHLRTAIEGRYVVARQLAAGGMSRVFLATEPALGRRVVIKVLPPDLAAEVSVERFRREMQVAARLQHPHIVPLLSAGNADDLLYYTMPFVEGESLRERLQKEGSLSIAETARIVREVADALAYAHAQGVVHRDIKPENLLISAGHVLVTDFGVAKAISGAVGAAGSAASLTTIGVALGTPSYMAPEQAVADPATDHRSDLYALGVVAYELLAGQPPFAGRSPRAVVAAHLTEQPVPLVQHRADVPEALGSLIMRLLEKDPDERPQSALDVVRLLDKIGAAIASGDHPIPARSPVAAGPATPDAAQPPRVLSSGLSRYTRWAVVGGLAVVASIAIAAWLGTRATRAQTPEDDLVAIVPFRVPVSDSVLAGLHEGVVDLLHDRFAHSVSPASVLEAWRRETGGRADADLPLERKLEIAKRLGAAQLISGSIVRMPRGIELRASLVGVSNGQSRTNASAVGAAEDFGALIDTVANQLLSIGAGEADRLYLLKDIPTSALRLYLDGKTSYRRGRYGEAAAYFERALDSSRTGDNESTFAFAAFGLVQASNYNRIRNDAPERALRIAWNARARLNPRDKALLDAQAGPTYPVLPMRREQISAWYRAMDSVTDRPEPYFEFADEVLEFRDYVEWPDAEDQARTSLEEALRKDSTFVPAVQRLTELAVATGDLARAEQLAARLPAGDSATDKSGYVLWRIATARGDQRRLTALRDRFGRLADASLRQIWLSAQLDGISMADATRALDAIARSAAHAEDRESVDVARYVQALNEGRPHEAVTQLKKAINEDAALVPFVEAQLIRDAIFADGDTAAARDAVARLTTAVRDAAQNPAPTPADEAGEYLARCGLEEWRLSRGSTDSTAATLGRLARIVPVIKPLRLGGTSTPVLGAEPVCPALIDAWAATLESRADAGAALERFDRLMARGPSDSDAPTGPATVSTIEASTIEDRTQVTPIDRVRDAPGVDVATTGIIQDHVVTRGFNGVFSGALLVLTDHRFDFVPSLRVNATSLIPATASDIDRMEIVLGPAAALYGPNAASGVLQILTKSPFDSPGTTLSATGLWRGSNQLGPAGGGEVLSLRHAETVGSAFGFKITADYLTGRDWRDRDSVELSSRAAALAQGANPTALLVGQRDENVSRWSVGAQAMFRPDPATEMVAAAGRTMAGNLIELTGIGAAQVRDWSVDYYQASVRRGFTQTGFLAALADSTPRTGIGTDYLSSEQTVFQGLSQVWLYGLGLGAMTDYRLLTSSNKNNAKITQSQLTSMPMVSLGTEHDKSGYFVLSAYSNGSMKPGNAVNGGMLEMATGLVHAQVDLIDRKIKDPTSTISHDTLVRGMVGVRMPF